MGECYAGLSADDKARVLFAAIGRSRSASQDANFCHDGVGAGHDASGDPTWSKMKSSQRDVSFFKRENGTWCFYCK